MQQVLSLDMQIPKTAKKAPSEEGLKQIINNDEAPDIDFQEFLSNLIVGKSEDKKSDVLTLKDDKNEPKLADNTTSLENILNLVTFLKSSSLDGKFPTDDKKLTKILNDKQALQDFKNVKSLDDILKVAKKYDIDIKEFKFSKDTAPKEIDFSKLLKNNIKESADKPLQTINKSNQNQITSEKVLNTLKNKIENKNDTKSTKEGKDILSTLLKKTKTNSTDINKNITETKYDNHNNKVKTSDIKDKKDNAKTHSIDTKELEQKDILSTKDIKEVAKNDTKNDVKLHKNSAKTVTKPKEQNEIKPYDKITKETDLKKTSEIKNSTKEVSANNSTRINEIKQNSSFENSKKFSEIVNTTKKPAKKVAIQEETKHKNQKELSLDSQKEIKHTEKPIESRNDIAQSSADKNKIHQATTIKVNDAKQSLNSFVNDLKEQIDNYKPPLMKIKMTLSPKDLGEVNVNLVTRGNSLQVTINSNTNTMALFTQNQAEFKNALVNMGFTNLNMNFSSNGNQNKHQGGSSKQNYKSLEELNEEEISTIDTVELTIPRYI